MAQEDKRPDCVVTGWYNGKFHSVLLRGEKNKWGAYGYAFRKGWSDVRVIQGIALAAGILAGFTTDRAQAAPTDDVKQYAMVQSAADILGDAQCGVPTTPMTKGRLTANGIDVQGRDNAQFLTTVNAVAQIYITDPKGFCRRAALNAGK